LQFNDTQLTPFISW